MGVRGTNIDAKDGEDRDEHRTGDKGVYGGGEAE